MYDTAIIAKKYGVKNTMHSCGYINEKPLRKLSKYIDAADIDLKGFTEDFYSKVCNGSLKPVLNSLVVLKEEGVWLEITNLVIPTLNDDMKTIKEMCRWILKNLGPDVPIHFSRFYPHYKLTNLPPTPLETLTEARKTAMDAGLKFVYIGNIRHEGESTYCPKCKKLLIERIGYFVKQNNVTNGKCKFCSTSIAGVWS
jgi:pyruvate formate lyase activating enzyme